MLDRFFRPRRRRFLLKRIRANPLAGEIEAFGDYLQNRGHSLNTILAYLQAIEHLGAWLGRQRIPTESLGEHVVSAFLGHVPRCTCPHPSSRTVNSLRAAARHFLRSLRQRGRIPERSPTPAVTPVDRTIREFDRYLVDTCGLSLNTRMCRLRYVRQFLTRRYGRCAMEPVRPSARDLMDFVADRASACTPGTAKIIASALRSYLRYLQLNGLCDSRLVSAVPTIPLWKLAHIPKTISPQDMKRFLSSFDRSTATGRRDFAMALCLTGCGLRVCETAQLRLDDIDWQQGTLRVPGGKTQRERLLPLPVAVGRAIAAYLRRDRPRSSERALFLRQRAPLGRPVTHFIVRAVMRRAHDRSGAAPWTGPHSLRHTLAARMLAGGARIKEVADVLGHMSIDTTAIYAKVNLPMLRQVPLPWPGRERP